MGQRDRVEAKILIESMATHKEIHAMRNRPLKAEL